MELVTGSSLAAVLADGRLEPRRTADVVAQAAAALHAAHAAHRTMGYLAPERVSGGSATVASDLYSLGIVAYEWASSWRPPSSVSVRTVNVSPALLGRPASVVAGELRGLGLVVQVRLRSDRQAAGFRAVGLSHRPGSGGPASSC